MPSDTPRVLALFITLAAGLALLASVQASTSIQLELHDAQGPTGAMVTQTDIRNFALVSPRGYSTVIDSRGIVDGYATIDGYYLDSACADGPYWDPRRAIPGTVFGSWTDRVGFVPHDAPAIQIPTGQTVFYREFAGACRSVALSEGGAFFLVAPNDPAVTGIKSAYPPPLRLKPGQASGGVCVFANGFDCRTTE